MPKIKIKVKINDEDYNLYSAIYQEKERILTYKEKDNTLVKYYYKDNLLIRENKEIIMKYRFEDSCSTGEIFVKDLKKKFYIDINTKIIKKLNKNLKIIYTIENEKYSYVVEVIE